MNIPAERRKKLVKIMRKESLDGLIITNVPDVSYLTGFTGDDSVLVFDGSKVTFVTDSRFLVQIERQCPELKVHQREKLMSDAVAAVFLGKNKKKSDLKGRKIGIQSPFMSVDQLQRYKKSLGSAITPVAHLVDQLRMVKDSNEASYIKKAAKIAGQAVANTVLWAKPGITEIEMCAYLEYQMMMLGADGPGFPTIIAFGGHASECHAQPGKLKLKKGQPFLIDWGARYKGYTSDITRCFCLGKLPTQVADAYRLLLEAQIAAINTIAPGVPLSAPDVAARKILAKCPDAYTHGTGHGIGLDVHEKPFLGSESTEVFREGMIVTVEPGIYPANKFGLRIEDDVLVTAKGRSVLTASVPKALEAVSI